MSIKHVKMSKDGVTTDVVESAFVKVWSKRGWALVTDDAKAAKEAPEQASGGESPLTGEETGSDKTSTNQQKKEAAK